MKTQVNWVQRAAQKSGRGKFMDFSTRGNPQSPLTETGMGAAASPRAAVVTFEINSGICYDLRCFFVTYLTRYAAGSNRALRRLQRVRQQRWASGKKE